MSVERTKARRALWGYCQKLARQVEACYQERRKDRDIALLPRTQVKAETMKNAKRLYLETRAMLKQENKRKHRVGTMVRLRIVPGVLFDWLWVDFILQSYGWELQK